ncbi:hypothetical protein ACIQTN_33955 [Streptomyces werraensis]|uniref:hypothetical protein n=1 Tax=Streptomyces werraensis TaxID=68284 RepID=UPI0037F343F3
MTSPLTSEQRSRRNREEHARRRREEAAQRGPRSVAAVWWDEARAVAIRQERNGDTAVWDRLCRVLEEFCGHARDGIEEATCPDAL